MDLNECLNSNIWLASCNQVIQVVYFAPYYFPPEVRKYGCHRPRVPHRDFNNHLTERICVYCSRRRPVSLEELAVLVLLRNIELLKKPDFAQSHHPQRIYWIIGRAINANLHVEALELAQFIPEDHEPSLALFDVEPDKEIILKRFLFYSSVYHKLKAHVENPSNLIDRIIEYLADFDNDYYDFWQVMMSASVEINNRDTVPKLGFRVLLTSIVKRILPWIDNEVLNLSPSKTIQPTSGIRSMITSVAKIFIPWLDNEILTLALSNKSWPTADRRDIIDIYVNIPALMRSYYKPGINCGGREYVSMKKLQRMQKRTIVGSVVLKTRAIANPSFLPKDVPSLLQNVDPQWISYVALTASSPWSVASIDELGRVLSACKNLSFIYLRQLTNAATPEDMALAVSRCLGHHPNLQKIGLGGFPLGEMMERYPLPPVAELSLYDCGLTDADWIFMTSRSDFALRELAVSSTLPLPPSPSLYAFILKQAPSLESLSLKYLTLMPNQVSDLITSVAQFNALQHLHVSYNHLDLVSMLNILLTIMPIASAERLAFEVPDEMPNVDMMISYLLTHMKTFCAMNRRLPICLSLIDHPSRGEEREVITVWHN